MCRFPFPLLSHLLFSFVISADVSTDSCPADELHGNNCKASAEVCINGTCQTSGTNFIVTNNCAAAGALCNYDPATSGTTMGVCKGTGGTSDCIPLSNGACATGKLGQICVASDTTYPENLGFCSDTDLCRPLKGAQLLGPEVDCSAASVNSICIRNATKGILGICIAAGAAGCVKPADTFLCNDANAGKVCVDRDLDSSDDTKVGICNKDANSDATCEFSDISPAGATPCTNLGKLCVTEGTKIQAGVCLKDASDECAPPKNGFHVGTCDKASVDKICLKPDNTLGSCTYIDNTWECSEILAADVICSDPTKYCVASAETDQELIFGFCNELDAGFKCIPFDSLCTSANYGKRCLFSKTVSGVCTPEGCLESELADASIPCAGTNHGEICVDKENKAPGLCAHKTNASLNLKDCITSVTTGFEARCETPGALCLARKNSDEKVTPGVCLNNLVCKEVIDGQWQVGKGIKDGSDAFDARILYLSLDTEQPELALKIGDGDALVDLLDGSSAFEVSCPENFICVTPDKDVGVCDTGAQCLFAPIPPPPPPAVFPVVTTTTTLPGCVALDSIGVAGCGAGNNGDSCVPTCIAEDSILENVSSDSITCSKGSWNPMPRCSPIPTVLEFDFSINLSSCEEEAVEAVQEAAKASLAKNLADFALAITAQLINCPQKSVAESESVAGIAENGLVEDGSESVKGGSVALLFEVGAETTGANANVNLQQLKSVISEGVAAASSFLRRDPKLKESIVSIPSALKIEEGVAAAALRTVEKKFKIRFSDNLSQCLFAKCVRKLPSVLRTSFNEIFGEDTTSVETSEISNCVQETKNDNFAEGSLTVVSSKLGRFSQAGAEREVGFYASGTALVFSLRSGYKDTTTHVTCGHLVVEDALSSKLDVFRGYELLEKGKEESNAGSIVVRGRILILSLLVAFGA